MRIVVDTESRSTLHPASVRRGQEWFNPLCREDDRSGLSGGGLVSACIISASRNGRVPGGSEGKDGVKGRQCPDGGQGGATQSAHVPASLGAGDIIYS